MPTFDKSKQLFELPVNSIEEYYPVKKTGQCDNPSDSRSYMETWTFTPLDVSGMNGRRKISIAQRVADAITKEQFEGEMSQYFSALKYAKQCELGK
jgi:hypothetical protein